VKFEDKVKGLREVKHKGRETSAFLSDVVLMAQGEPYEYLLGEVVFCNTKVDLSYRPMIPRPETEFWMKSCLSYITNIQKENLKCLDMFCGSGALGLSFLKQFPDSFVSFVDKYVPIKEQIELSLKKNNLDENRAAIFVEDVEYFFCTTKEVYDVIFAVPPYVDPLCKEDVMRELNREKELFFFDKEDGFYFHRIILRYGKNFLTQGGFLCIEFDYTQYEKITSLVHEHDYAVVKKIEDPYGNTTAFILKRLS